MYCKSCGTNLPDDAIFCHNCGADTAAASSSTSTQSFGSAGFDTFYTPTAPSVPSGPILTFGILALAFACTFYLSFLGIIFGRIAMSKGTNYLAQTGMLTGKAKVGHILGRVGFILGLVFTILFGIVLTVLIFEEM